MASSHHRVFSTATDTTASIRHLQASQVDRVFRRSCGSPASLFRAALPVRGLTHTTNLASQVLRMSVPLEHCCTVLEVGDEHQRCCRGAGNLDTAAAPGLVAGQLLRIAFVAQRDDSPIVWEG